MLTFARCGAFAADQDAGSQAYGWGESYASADGARERAVAECGSRGGTGCFLASSTIFQNRGRDAADCRRLFDVGRIRLFGVDLGSGRIDFGDDASGYAGDGECDDPRFDGDGMDEFPLVGDRGHDATDCRRLYDAGRIRLFGVRLGGVQ